MEQTTDRRAAARRRRKRDSRNWKLIRYVFAAAAILLAANVFFEITNIQVSGNVIYSENEVLEASGLTAGRSALTVSGWATARRIRKALPGVSGAGVSLSLPDTLVIHVTETPALAILETPLGEVLLSEDCRVVSGFDGSEALIHVKGVSPVSAEVGSLLAVSEAEGPKLSYLQELLPLLESEKLLGEVSDLDVSNVSDLHFTYQGRFTVRLGEQEKLENKLNLLQRIVGTLSAGDRGILDLSTNQEGHYIPG